MDTYILISGATSGIGKATALRLSQYHNVIVMGRDDEKVNSVVSACNNSPFQVLPLTINLDTEVSQVSDKLTSFIKEKNIVIEQFVHCAGFTKILPLRSFSFDQIQSIFNVNVFSGIEILKTLVKRVNHKSLNNVVFISALWSIRGERANAIYASSKGAINSLIPSVAKELAPDVRVNAILPGGVETPMSAEMMNSEQGKLQEKDYPLGFGRIDDIVNMIEFLLSDKSKWITGQLISVDGGRSIL